MGIEDLKTIGKVVSKVDEATAVAKVAELTVFEYEGVKYAFPKGTRKEDALRFLWQSGIGPGKKGEEITLPSTLHGPRWDAEKGMGSVPMGGATDFTYNQGFIREMTPREFFENVPGSVRKIKEESVRRYQSLEEGYREGKSLAPPFLTVRWDEQSKWWKMQGHEGRHRAALIESYYGDTAKMPVQIHPTGYGGGLSWSV